MSSQEFGKYVVDQIKESREFAVSYLKSSIEDYDPQTIGLVVDDFCQAYDLKRKSDNLTMINIIINRLNLKLKINIEDLEAA